MEFLAELEYKFRTDQFTSSQTVIKTAFGGHLPKCKIETVLSINESMIQICERGNEAKIHWVPGHRDIEGNKLADRQAKEAAAEMSAPDLPILPVLDKREVISEIKRNR